MAQPSTQLLLDTGHAFYGYLWYANDTGLWDARNGAMATKTGSGAVTADGEGGANVVNSSGTTRYSTGALTSLSYPSTLGFKVKQTTPGDAGIVIGDRTGTTSYFWLRASEVRPFGLTTANSNPDSWATFHVVFAADGSGKLYKNGAFVANIPWSASRPVNSILSGYSGDSYALSGKLEYLLVIPGLEASAGQVSSLYADPYQALAAASGSTPASVPSATGTSTGSGSGGEASSPSGLLTTPVLKNNTGTVLATEAGATAYVYNPTTGDLIVKKTSQTTNESGVMVIADPLIVASTPYRVVVVLASGAEGMERLTAT